jgi:hypothetical protein
MLFFIPVSITKPFGTIEKPITKNQNKHKNNTFFLKSTLDFRKIRK